MAAYLVANFALTNPAGYKSYVFAVMPTLEAHGAEVLVADYESKPLEGNAGSVTVVLRFPSAEARDAWYWSPEYQKVIHLRTDNSKGIAVSANEFDLEHNLRILETY
ncbi:MAG: DUF1330 domain-containing protein [Candidatus Binatia bacterium]